MIVVVFHLGGYEGDMPEAQYHRGDAVQAWLPEDIAEESGKWLQEFGLREVDDPEFEAHLRAKKARGEQPGDDYKTEYDNDGLLLRRSSITVDIDDAGTQHRKDTDNRGKRSPVLKATDVAIRTKPARTA